jgi:hypothetical protein
MKKWAKGLNRDFSKEELQMSKKREIFKIHGHKGNVNQSHVKILPHSF